jgi:cytochrome c biogenesis protein CcmG/thiol:disulfide interchange protein DsbE
MALAAVVNGQSKKAANFVLKSADGTTYELSKMKGKVVVINFWATWCGPCRKEIPDFIEAYKKYNSKGLEIIGISLDQDGWTKVTPFVKQNNINYPIVLGDENITDNYGGINAIPTTFIVDKNGTIVDKTIGLMSLKQLEAKLKSVL